MKMSQAFFLILIEVLGFTILQIILFVLTYHHSHLLRSCFTPPISRVPPKHLFSSPHIPKQAQFYRQKYSLYRFLGEFFEGDFLSLGQHTWQCSRFTVDPGSKITLVSVQGAIRSPDWSHPRKAPYILYYLWLLLWNKFLISIFFFPPVPDYLVSQLSGTSSPAYVNTFFFLLGLWLPILDCPLGWISYPLVIRIPISCIPCSFWDVLFILHGFWFPLLGSLHKFWFCF